MRKTSPLAGFSFDIERLEQRQLLAVTVGVDLNAPNQTIRGIGANVTKNARNPDPNGPIKDSQTVVQLQNYELGMVRVAINLKTWEPANDNNDPNVVRPPGFPDFGGIKQNFEFMREQTQKGIPVIATLLDLPNWMVSNPEAVQKRELKVGFETELAESISHWLNYARQQYGVKIDFISINEGNGGYNARFNQLIFTNFLKKAGPFMAGKGLGYVKWFFGDDGVGTLNAHTKPLLENPEIRQYLGPVAYHSWSFRFINDANLEQWYVQANRYGKEVWVTEFGTSEFGADITNFQTWTRARDTANSWWRALTVTRANVVLWWQFANDFPFFNSQNQPLPLFHTTKPFFDHVKPGSQMVKTTPNNSGSIKTLASKDVGRNKFFAQVLNSASAGTAGNTVTLSGLPNQPMTITRSTEAAQGAIVGTFTPVNGRLTFSSPADSVIYVTGKLNSGGVSQAPTAAISAPVTTLQYTAGGTVNFSGTASDAEDGLLAAGKFNWTITPVRDGIFGAAQTFAGVKSGTFTVPAGFQRSVDQRYVIELKVTDSSGLTNTKSIEIHPKIINVTVAANVPGVSPGLNGFWESLTTPIPVVAGVQNLFAPSPQLVDGRIYKFSSWSIGGAATQSVTTSTNASYIANFVEVTDGSAGAFAGTSDDSYVRDGDGGDVNYGQATELQAKISNDAGKTRYAYLRFDLTTPQTNTAKLRVFGNLSGAGDLVPTYAYGVNPGWNENTITFNNRPQFIGNPIAAQTVADTLGRWYEFDVTTYVKLARLGGATAVSFALTQIGNSSPFAGFPPRQPLANPPQLLLSNDPSTPPPPPPPPSIAATVRGKVFQDDDSDGVYDIGEDLVGGVTVYIDRNNNSVPDFGEPSEITNELTGRYSFSGLAAGTYKLRLVLPSGFTQVAPANNASNDATVSGSQVVENKDFIIEDGVIEPPPPPPPGGATIRGTVFLDSDRDGVFDNGEAGVAGRTIYLDANNNSVRDASESQITTDVSGAYAFTNLSAGDYKIRQVLPSGFNQTSPANNFGNNAIVSGTQVATGENFGTTSTTTPVERELNTAADSYVRDAAGNSNYGTATEMSVQSGGSGINRRAYLKFDISSINSFSSVILKLSGRLSESVTNGLSVGVYNAPDAWTETGLTWNNRPRENSTPIGSVRVRDTARRTYELDLTAYIQAQKAAGRQFVTLVLKNMTNTASAQSVFAAREFTGGGARLTVS